MSFRPSRSTRSSHQALAEALRRPPLRVGLRYEPGDRIDGYPTITLEPCRAATAIAALDRAESGVRTRVIVGGADLIEPGASSLCHAARERLAQARIAGSLVTDTADIIAISRAIDTRLTVVSIDGPVEARDAEAIESAIAAGDSVLDADIRVTAIVQCGSAPGTASTTSAASGAAAAHSTLAPLAAQFRDADEARRFIAVLTRSYIARTIGEPFEAIAPLGHELFGRCTEGFTLRPHEIRIDGPMLTLSLRRPANRAIRTLTLDRTIGRWFTSRR